MARWHESAGWLSGSDGLCPHVPVASSGPDLASVCVSSLLLQGRRKERARETEPHRKQMRTQSRTGRHGLGWGGRAPLPLALGQSS